jgi:tripartite-type tricarboxylate transporter receptor subunit TctC
MRNIVTVMALGTVLAAVSLGAAAQAFPSKPVRLIVPFAAGGPIDLISRTVASKLTEPLGQLVIVENKAGAGGSVAAEYTAKSTPDGYTIMLITVGTQTINPALFSKVGYDPLKDFTYITPIGTYSLVLVANPKLEAKTLVELIALAKTKPNTLNFGSGGNGSSSHLAGELFKMTAALQMQHIPYKGSAAALTDVVAGNTSFLFDLVSGPLPLIQSGKARAIAWTGVKRTALMPDVPTMSEAGMTGFDITGWVGVGAPAGLQKNVLERLHGDILKSLNSPDLKEKLIAQGYELSPLSPTAFTEIVRRDVVTWGKVVRESGAKVD